MSAQNWRWVCEACYRTTRRKNLPPTWQLVAMSAICPECLRRADASEIGYANLKGGQWAGKRKDPRTMPNLSEIAQVTLRNTERGTVKFVLEFKPPIHTGRPMSPAARLAMEIVEWFQERSAPARGG